MFFTFPTNFEVELNVLMLKYTKQNDTGCRLIYAGVACEIIALLLAHLPDTCTYAILRSFYVKIEQWAECCVVAFEPCTVFGLALIPSPSDTFVADNELAVSLLTIDWDIL